MSQNKPTETPSPADPTPSTKLSFDAPDTVSSADYEDVAFPAPFSDLTGQVPPPWLTTANNSRTTPRVVATLWEDEGTLLFTVQLNGVSVTRREDNHMVNASALLKAAGWSTERAEGRLEGEEVRHVVEGACSEYLDGVWVPFSEAMDIANEAGVVEGLYPLFVYNLGALLYDRAVQGPAVDLDRPGGRFDCAVEGGSGE